MIDPTIFYLFLLALQFAKAAARTQVVSTAPGSARRHRHRIFKALIAAIVIPIVVGLALLLCCCWAGMRLWKRRGTKGLATPAPGPDKAYSADVGNNAPPPGQGAV